MKFLRMTALMLMSGFLSAAVMGCGSSDAVNVSGTASYKGKPLANYIINFKPENGTPSIGKTDAQGNFTLSYGADSKGAVRGKHTVSIEPINMVEQQLPGVPATEIDPDTKAMRDKYSPVNSKYSVDITGPITDLKINLD